MDRSPESLRLVGREAPRKRIAGGREGVRCAGASSTHLRKKISVSVEYFDGEPYESLNLNKEPWGLITGPNKMISSQSDTAADIIVKRNTSTDRTKGA